jgi:hypothetical protein
MSDYSTLEGEKHSEEQLMWSISYNVKERMLRLKDLWMCVFLKVSVYIEDEWKQNLVNKGCVRLWFAICIKKYRVRQKKKNYGNSNTSPCKNIIFKNSATNLKSKHKPKYHLSKIVT